MNSINSGNHPKKIKLFRFIGSFLGLGFIPIARGTIATIIAVVIYLLFPDAFKAQISLILAFIFFFISIPILTELEKFDGSDPNYFVLDKMIGIWFAFSNPFFQAEFLWIVVIFVLFRLFNIFKPFPINLLNSKQGPFFVLADDIASGLIASLIYQIFYMIYNFSGLINLFTKTAF